MRHKTSRKYGDLPQKIFFLWILLVYVCVMLHIMPAKLKTKLFRKSKHCLRTKPKLKIFLLYNIYFIQANFLWAVPHYIFIIFITLIQNWHAKWNLIDHHYIMQNHDWPATLTPWLARVSENLAGQNNNNSFSPYNAHTLPPKSLATLQPVELRGTSIYWNGHNIANTACIHFKFGTIDIRYVPNWIPMQIGKLLNPISLCNPLCSVNIFITIRFWSPNYAPESI